MQNYKWIPRIFENYKCFWFFLQVFRANYLHSFPFWDNLIKKEAPGKKPLYCNFDGRNDIPIMKRKQFILRLPEKQFVKYLCFLGPFLVRCFICCEENLLKGFLRCRLESISLFYLALKAPKSQERSKIWTETNKLIGWYEMRRQIQS